MIDLKNTYIENDRGELRELYLKEASKHGYKCSNAEDYIFEYLMCTGEDYVQDVDCSNNVNRKITLADLKPNTKQKRVKVSYEKVDSSEAVHYFTDIATDLYFEPSDSSNPVELQGYIDNLALGEDQLYRKVESEFKTEIRWIAYNSKANIVSSIQCKTKDECYNTLQGNKFRDEFQYLEVEVEIVDGK